RPSKVVLFIHGGGYITLSHKTHRVITSRVAKETGYRVLAIDYRLAPEYPFPAAVHDAFASYLFLIDPTNPATHLIVFKMGDSAGGGLTLALLLYLKSFLVSPTAPHTPIFQLPRSATVFSPWVDLACGMESWHRNIKTDYLPPLAPDFFHRMYSDTMNPDVHLTMLKWVRHPLISPIYGDFAGLPPIYIQAGSAEVLVDESNLIAYLLSRAGVQVQHEVYMDMPHVFQIIPSMLSPPHQAFERVADFAEGKLDAESVPGVFVVDGWKENVGTWERLRTGYVEMFPPWEGTSRVPAENGSEEVEVVRLKEMNGARKRVVKGKATDSATMFHPLMDYL
ncbi:Alpha/Beta hydrolase protein, partial [Cladochytrium replicatum]